MISAPTLFAVLSLEQIPLPTGFRLRVTTNVACHLWCRITTTQPREHKIPRLMRGLALKDDKYFCFVVYHDNEQEEAGDTLVHTFYKLDWPICETRWFYFHGTINGIASPSTTAIFEKHRTLPDYWMLIDEPWSTAFEPPDFTLIIDEPWTTSFSPPVWVILHEEPWTS